MERTEEPAAIQQQLTGAAESGPAAPVPAESSVPAAGAPVPAESSVPAAGTLPVPAECSCPVPPAGTLPVPPVPASWIPIFWSRSSRIPSEKVGSAAGGSYKITEAKISSDNQLPT